MTSEMKEGAGGKDRPLDELIRQLSDADVHVRAEARHWLCARAKEAVPRLIEAIQPAEEAMRFEISRVLAEMGEVTLKPMMDAIRHPDLHVRTVAARVLSLIGTEEARKLLNEAASSEQRKTVRKELREASANIARRIESVEARAAERSRQERIKPRKPDELSEKQRQEKKLYLNIVRNLILSNWARPRLFPPQGRPEEVLVTLKVDRDGSVSRVLIENKWQNSPLGESLKDAVRRSAPFPPVPEAVAPGKSEIDITFILPVPS